MTGDDTIILISACALATFATRIGGHLVLTRFKRIHYRIEAALDAVPIAVMTALVAPYLVSFSWRESAVLVLAVIVSMRFSMITTVLIGLGALVLLRAF